MCGFTRHYRSLYGSDRLSEARFHDGGTNVQLYVFGLPLLLFSVQVWCSATCVIEIMVH